MAASANPFAVIAADVQGLTARVVAGLAWFGKEAAAAIAWVDQNIPGAQAALAGLFQVADTAAIALESHAAAGFADVVSGEVDAAGTTIANILSRSGLDLTSRQILSAADVATVTAAHAIAQGAISVATARILGETAQTAAAAKAAGSGPKGG